jgi:hypothetical protein
MAQFDFPRLNFSGYCSIDPATANNGWYMPLVIFQPITIQAVCPPKLYLEDQYILNGNTLDDVKKLLPEGVEIQMEMDGHLKDVPFIEISTIDTDEKFKEWASLPLGSYELDKEYAAIYKITGPGSDGTSELYGCVPGYWNYYGTMQYRYQDVQVRSATLGVTDEAFHTVKEDEAEGVLKQLIGANLDMNLRVGDDSSNASVMVDLLPTMAMYSQIFCDRMNLIKDRKVLFSGKPKKASLRLVNSFRVVNENMPQGASGVFFSVVPMEDLLQQKHNPLIDFFEAHRDKRKKLKGVFIQQMISEVEEIREVDYNTVGRVSNPAIARVGGTIAPWYEEDLINWPASRQMNGVAPFLHHESPKYMAPIAMMTPAVFKVDHERGYLQLDFLNNFPVINTTQESDEPLEPRPDEENTYATYNLGEVELSLKYSAGKNAEPEAIALGRRTINNDTWPREKYYTEGGMLLFSLKDIPGLDEKKIKNGDICLNLISTEGQTPLLAESPMVYVTEQCGMYSNLNDDPMKGFLSNSAEKELCVLNIFKRGERLKTPTALSIIEIKMAFGGSGKSEKVFRKDYYKDGDILILPNSEASNAIYLFTNEEVYDPLPPQYPLEVVGTGFYLNLKVLPAHDFGRYLNPNHPDYQEQITFEDMYKEVFQCYALITPVMRFSEESWNNEHLAQLLVEKTHPDHWASSGYMPVSRDMSRDQILLIRKWASSFKKLKKNFPMGIVFEELRTLEKIEAKEKLKNRQFFNK